MQFYVLEKKAFETLQDQDVELSFSWWQRSKDVLRPLVRTYQIRLATIL